MDPWLAYILGMITIPGVALIYIGIAKAVEGNEQWKRQLSEFDQRLDQDPLSTKRVETPSERYWINQVDQ